MLAAGRVAPAAWRPLALDAGKDPAPQGGPAPPPGSSFHAIGVRRDLDAPALWTDPGDGLLFLFHLHAFAGLAEDPAAPGWPALVHGWLNHCGRPGGPGWHPFPLSGRLIAWSAALSAGAFDAATAARMQASMRRQLVLLRHRVEHDVGGNHVLRNATALVVAGHCLVDARAAAQGERLLAREIPLQVGADGGHEERSTSYHREVLADLETAASVLDAAGRSVPWRDHLEPMRAWLAALAAPDGSLPLIGDAWEGPPVAPLADAVTELEAHVVLRGDGVHVVLNTGPLGPPHLPAHLHAHALAFSVWMDGRWVVADPGAFTYAGSERDAYRGTGAHATVTVDGRDQCRFWGAFRATRLPQVHRRPLERRPDGWLVLEAWHAGYRPAVHHRTFAFHPQHGLAVRDRVEGGGDAVSHLPLGPSAEPELVSPAAASRSARFSPFIGTSVPTLALEQRGPVTGWDLLRPGAPTPPI